MSEIKKDTIAGKAFDFKLFKRVLFYVKPYKRKFIWAIAQTFILSFISIATPLIIMYIINVCIPNKDVKMLLYMTLAGIAVLILQAILQFSNGYLTSWLGQTIIKDIRVQIYRHIISLRAKYFDNTPIGQLVTQTISDIEAISDIFSQGFIVIMGDILTLIVFIVAMFLVNWKFALAVMASVPLLLFATYIFKNSVKASFQDVRTQVARLNTFVQEHITGMKIVQIFNRENAEYEKFKKINILHRDANIRSVFSYSVFFPVVEILLSVSVGLLVWKAGSEMFHWDVEAGEVTFFLMLTNMFFRPIRMLADRVNVLQMGMVASERVFRVLDTKETNLDNGKIEAQNISGETEFKNVWFAYNEENYVLKDVSFKVNKNETVALVGATGSGKTSIINLLNRFYEYNKGEIKIDGVNICDYTLDSLRRNIAVVLQDVFLFSDTIANNISLNNSEITRQKIIEASKAVGAHDFIMKLSGNYDYNVMERGAMLSVGQRQLIAFVRAYVYNPKILVLDEATSSIDTETEIFIQKAIEKLTENRTSIVIAHRLATIQRANKILVLDHGKIIETGNHQELLKQNGQYKKLFELQFKGDKILSY